MFDSNSDFIQTRQSPQYQPQTQYSEFGQKEQKYQTPYHQTQQKMPPRSIQVKNPLNEQYYATLSNAQEEKFGQDEQQIVNILTNLNVQLQEITEHIDIKQNEKIALIEDINTLEQRLNYLNKSIQRKKAILQNYEKTQADGQIAFNKIVESTKSLLGVIQKENLTLEKTMSIKQTFNF